jgi:prolyl 4-hydroxylase
VAVIPRTDVVRCIEDRARSLQGWRDEVWLEKLRVQRYFTGGHYNHHFDWNLAHGGWGRVSSFMVWVDDGDGELEGGGTEFPLLKPKRDPRWCRFVECTDIGDDDAEVHEKRSGVIFKPIPGNAVYWENFRSDGSGRGFQETWHAGLPVVKGVKVGLNIWSWGRLD